MFNIQEAITPIRIPQEAPPRRFPLPEGEEEEQQPQPPSPSPFPPEMEAGMTALRNVVAEIKALAAAAAAAPVQPPPPIEHPTDDTDIAPATLEYCYSCGLMTFAAFPSCIHCSADVKPIMCSTGDDGEIPYDLWECRRCRRQFLDTDDSNGLCDLCESPHSAGCYCCW